MSHQIYGKCGICIGYLTDPCSLIISTISPDTPSCIGTYHETSNSTYILNLYNTYDERPVSWILPNTVLTHLLTLSGIQSLTLYPLSVSIPIPVSKTDFPPDYPNLSYKNLLYKTYPDLCTGYTIVNTLLASLITPRPTISHTQLIPCSALGTPYIRESSQTTPTDNLALSCTKDDLKLLLMHCTDLFITNQDFRTQILNKFTKPIHNDLRTDLRSDCRSDCSSEDLDPNAIFDLGTQLKNIVSAISDPTDSGVINFGGVMAAYARIVSSVKPQKRATIPKLFSGIGEFVGPRPITGNISVVLHGKNKSIVQSTASEYHTISKRVVVTVPTESVIGTEARYNAERCSNSDIQYISMFGEGHNLTSLSNEHLIDILLYIDSLRDSNGMSDTRFAGLQNNITRELAKRSNTSE